MFLCGSFSRASKTGEAYPIGASKLRSPQGWALGLTRKYSQYAYHTQTLAFFTISFSGKETIFLQFRQQGPML